MKPARQRLQTQSKFRHGLAEKLSFSLIISTAIIFATYGWLNLRLQQKGAQDLILHSADGIGDLIKRSTRYEMLHNDREGLHQSIRDIGSEPGIERIRVFNKEGRVAFSTDDAEFNQVVSKQAPVCLACHAQPVSLLKLDRPKRWHIYTNDKQQRVMAVVRAIENEPGCSSGACHAHPASTKVLGLIDTHLSLAAVDARVAEHQRSLIALSFAAVLLISAVSIAFVLRVVQRPIRELISGTYRVAHGDLNHRLEVYSADEIGDLAWSFDRMTDQLASAHDELTSWAKTLEDRVAAKTLELERVHTKLLASAKMASLGNLAATVAHEVNNPLFGILTYARLGLKDLEKKDGDPKMLERLRIIERESLRCGDIMRNLLTFARQTPKKREPRDVNALIGHALALMKHKAELQGVAVEADLARGLPDVDCDGGQIQQTVLVLLVNATEAMSSGGTVRVRSTRDSVRDEVRISVQDDGPGIPAAAAAKIFDPFFTTKEDQQRTGLGLAIARSIVEQHGGLLTVNSVEGHGAEFVFTLPLVPVAVMANGGTR